MFRFAFAFLIAFALPVAAQQGILGNVTDASGAAVPAANIRILNTDTNAASLTTTNGEGFFTAPSLPVGSYSVTAEKTGFKKALRSGITLQVDQRAQVDLSRAADEELNELETDSRQVRIRMLRNKRLNIRSFIDPEHMQVVVAKHLPQPPLVIRRVRRV